MGWTVVHIDHMKSSRGKPTASIGFGRIALNSAACDLIENYDQYNYVELLTDKERPSAVALRFLVEETPNSLPLKRRTSNGRTRGGADIYSKTHIQKLFGIKGTQNKTTPYSVIKESDDILVINIT